MAQMHADSVTMEHPEEMAPGVSMFTCRMPSRDSGGQGRLPDNLECKYLENR